MLSLIAGITVFLVYSGEAPCLTDINPKSENCAKCHTGPGNDIKAAGGRHRNVPCVGCHVGHPPEIKKPSEKCSKCHPKTRKVHFERQGCLTCHRNPHTPLVLAKDACADCHSEKFTHFQDNKSRHSTVECTACHVTHGKMPQCNQCHKPHSEQAVVADCKKCHKGHMPKAATYASDIISMDCAACHKKAFDLLNSSKTRHNALACSICHEGSHKTVPACQSCHGLIHWAALMNKFPKCGECHNMAHDLNTWPEPETKAAR